MNQTIIERKKPSLTVRLLLILLICLGDIVWDARLIYRWQEAGVMISVRDASSAFGTALLQQLILAAVPILLLVIVWIVLKDRFTEEMALSVSGKKQRMIVLILIGVLLCEAVVARSVKRDPGSVLYSLLHYTVFIAFTEEFVIRGVCASLLKEEKTWLR